MTADPVVPGRSCSGCSLCCKLIGVNALEKPPNVWCKHCQPDSGCGIYDDRPQECRDYNCAYRTSTLLDEHWKPSLCKMVLYFADEGRTIVVRVDPSRPDAWRREPYYSQLKGWARIAAARRLGRIEVRIAGRGIVVFPDRDVDLGILRDDEVIVTGRRRSQQGIEFVALKIHKDDARLKGRQT